MRLLRRMVPQPRTNSELGRQGALTTRLTTVPSGQALTRGQMGEGVTVHWSRAVQLAAVTVIGSCCTFRNQVKPRVCGQENSRDSARYTC